MKTIDKSKVVGKVLAAKDGREVRLAMQDLFVGGCVTPAGARLVVRHVFASAEDRPLEVVYACMLPRDAALRSFEVVGRDFRVKSELKPRKEAEEDYEKALEKGRLAVLAQEHEDGLVNLAVGNLRPGETVAVHLEVLAGVEGRDGGFRFRFPFTVAPVYHRDAGYGVNEKGQGEIDLPASFGGAMLPPWSLDGSKLHRVSFDLEIDAGSPVTAVKSPSHPLQLEFPAGARPRAKLAVTGDLPDRDLVLDVEYAAEMGTVFGAAGEFVAVLPSTLFGPPGPDAARKVVFVLDRSGSMGGSDMEQALRALRACLATLAPADRFAIVAFDTSVETTGARLLAGDRKGREAAARFLDGIDARGGTELAAAVRAAAKIAGKDADLMVLTDGQVGGTDEILSVARNVGCRLHTLGIGSASQDRFLSRLARDCGGVGRFVGPRERVDAAALDWFASAGRPVAEDVKVGVDGDDEARIEPAPPGMVFAGVPLTAYVHAASAARGIRIEWKGADRPLTLAPPSCADAAAAETARLLRGARLIADYQPDADAETGAVARRGRKRAEDRLARISAEYGLASRAMSLVAVVARKGDRAGGPPKTTVVPVGLPQDLSREAYFAAAAPAAAAMYRMPPHVLFKSATWSRSRRPASVCDAMPARMFIDATEPSFSMPCKPPPPPSERAGLERAMELAARIEPDGGMPGRDPEARVAASLAVFGCLAAGGAERIFRRHLGRLEQFLAGPAVAGLPAEARALIGRILDSIRNGTSDPAVWKRLAARLLKGETLRLADLPGAHP